MNKISYYSYEIFLGLLAQNKLRSRDWVLELFTRRLDFDRKYASMYVHHRGEVSIRILEELANYVIPGFALLRTIDDP